MASSFNITQFSGTDMQAFAKFNAADGSVVTIKLGTLSAITGVTKAVMKPKMVIGSRDPIGIATGTRITSGSLRFEVFNESFLNAAKHNVDASKYFMFNDKEIKSPDELPPLDIIMTAVSETDPTKKAIRKIIGVVLVSQGSAIGLDSLTVQESYDFIAQSIEPLTEVKV